MIGFESGRFYGHCSFIDAIVDLQKRRQLRSSILPDEVSQLRL
jgi:hypothetical protein